MAGGRGPGHEPGPRERLATEAFAIPGTNYRLYYHGDGAPGRKDPYTLEVTLRAGRSPRRGRKRIDLEIRVAGRRILLPDQHDPKTTFIWDGLDAYGRPVQGSRPAVVRVGYVYDAAPPTRQECILWREQRVMLATGSARAQNLGGWTLNIHHAYDPIGPCLHLGGGGRREGTQLPAIITTVAGDTAS